MVLPVIQISQRHLIPALSGVYRIVVTRGLYLPARRILHASNREDVLPMRNAVLVMLVAAMVAGSPGSTVMVLVQRHRGRQRLEMYDQRLQARAAPERIAHLAVPIGALTPQKSPLVRIGSREVNYRGCLYDIVLEVRIGAVLHLWGFHDVDEEAAARRLASEVQDDLSGQGGVFFSRLTRLAQPATSVPDGPVIRPPDSSSVSARPQSELEWSPPFLDIPHPPPRLVRRFQSA